jgi:hypothetical protein
LTSLPRSGVPDFRAMFLISGSSGMGGGRSDARLEQAQRLPLSSVHSSPSGSSQDRRISGEVQPSSPGLASPGLVRPSIGTPDRSSSLPPTTGRSPLSRQATSPTRGPSVASSSRVATLQRCYTSAGFPEHLATRLVNARRASTNKIYESKWKRWVAWCLPRAIDPCHPTVVHLSTLLEHLFQERLNVSAIKGYRSAINSVLRTAGNPPVISDFRLSELIEAFGIERPVQRRLFPAWDLPLVLRSLLQDPYEPLNRPP